MSWEREFHHINLDEGEYRIGLVERNVQNRHGEPARHLIQIQMGSGAFEYQAGNNSVRIKLGGDFTIKPDGSLQDAEGHIFDPRDFESRLIAELNNHHAMLRAFARKQGAPELKPKGQNAGIPKTAHRPPNGTERPQNGLAAGKSAEPKRPDQLPGPSDLQSR